MNKKQKNLVKKIETLITGTEEVRKQIYEKIMAIPENPDIKQLDDKGRCFEMNSSKLSADMVLSPAYYIFKLQCVHIIEQLEKIPVGDIPKKLKEITTPTASGNFILKGRGYAYRINPAVVKFLKEIL